MAFKSKYRSIFEDGKKEMTVDQFKKWLRILDADKDGQISKEDLRDAIRANGGWFSRWKAHCALKSADVNGNGYVDVDEFHNLVAFAEKELRVKIIPSITVPK